VGIAGHGGVGGRPCGTIGFLCADAARVMCAAHVPEDPGRIIATGVAGVLLAVSAQLTGVHSGAAFTSMAAPAVQPSVHHLTGAGG
jgi:hypothetical protein